MKNVQAATSAVNAAPRASAGGNTTLRLLDAAKRAQGIPSNYRLARVLGVSDNTMTKWTQGRAAPANAMAIRLAAMAGQDAGVVVAELAAERAQDDDERDLWRGIAARLRQVGMAAVFGAIMTLGAPSPEARATTVQADEQHGLCVMSNRRRRKGRGDRRRKSGTPANRRTSPGKSAPGPQLH